jgi:hypothetical protein
MAAEDDSSIRESVLSEDPVAASQPTEGGSSKAKAKKKQEPGKLPPVSKEPATKDSRDAAAAALRNWNRRG